MGLKMNDNQGLHIHVSTTFTSVSQNYISSVDIRKIDHWHLCLHPYDEAWIQGSARLSNISQREITYSIPNLYSRC